IENFTNQSSFVIIINDFGFSHRARVLNNRATNRIDPLLFLLLSIRHKVLGAPDGEASAHRDDATWSGAGGDVVGVFEPKELALFQNEPTAAPRFDVVALLC
ncbi:hypothetical protein CUMW_032440, partial [Citrus unshiu]